MKEKNREIDVIIDNHSQKIVRLETEMKVIKEHLNV